MLLFLCVLLCRIGSNLNVLFFMLISVLFEEKLLERDLDFIVFVGRIIIEIWGI